jgi:uncharacterized protein
MNAQERIMVIDIRTIPEGHSELVQETDLGAFKDDLPLLCGTISCNAAIDRNGPDLYIHLQFHCMYELECSRCLEPISFPVDGDARVVVKELPGKHGAAHEEEESVDYFYDSRNLTLDLSPSIYEEIMIAFPLKPICSESCKGFDIYKDTAASAKQNVQEKTEVDPRWAALKKLKKQ